MVESNDLEHEPWGHSAYFGIPAPVALVSSPFQWDISVHPTELR